MTATPEKRAQSLIAKMIQMRPTPDARVSVDLIAQAIRDAEDAALERAAIVVQTKVSMAATTFEQAGEKLRDRNGDEHFLGAKSVNELIERKASDIRSLKHSKETQA